MFAIVLIMPKISGKKIFQGETDDSSKNKIIALIFKK